MPYKKSFVVFIGGMILLLSGVAFAQWGTPVKLGPNINTDSTEEEDPFITADGQKLFFISSRVGSLDIWFSVWDSNIQDWGVPVRLPPPINSGQNDDYSPSVSPDGKKLYFQSFGGGYGGWDVWMAPWDSVNNQWGTPENLGPNINYIFAEWSPKISADGKRLYYQSQGRGHPQGTAIFTSIYDDSLGWQPPVAFPDWINNSGSEEGPYVSPDGKNLFFVRWLVGGPGGLRKIFWSQWLDTNWSGPIIMDTNTINKGTSWAPFLGPDGRLYYCGNSDLSATTDIWVVERITTEVEESKNSAVPRVFDLYQNYPNPFNPTATIGYALPQPAKVELKVFNILGQAVRTLVNEEKGAGYYQVVWDGKDEVGRTVSTGIYLYQIKAGDFVETKKMQLIK